MRLWISIMLATIAVTLGVTGCARDPWATADESIAGLAREVADRAESGDTHYFDGIVAAHEKVPVLMEQIQRSSIATTYAEHLIVESETDASLVYHKPADSAPGTSFTVQLSLVDGKARIDQIVAYDIRETSDSPATLNDPPVPPVVDVPEAKATYVSVAIASDEVLTGSEQTALICYTNLSDKSMTVQAPLVGELRVTDTMGGLVSSWPSSRDPEAAGRVELAPLQRTYDAIAFEAPAPGSYLLYARALGAESPPATLQSVTERKDGGFLRAIKGLFGKPSDE